jgi:cysteine-rich repeat protein
MTRKHIASASIGVVAVASLVLQTLPAFAAPGPYTLFGTATNQGGFIQTVSIDPDPSPAVSPAFTFGGIDFAGYDGQTYSSLSDLSTDYNVTDDDCGGGAPRFSIALDTDGNGTSNGRVFVYIGPGPSFTGCTPNTWVNTGNLFTSPDGRFDGSQLSGAGGAYGQTGAQSLAALGSAIIKDIDLVTDAGWSQPDSEQTVLFDNTQIDGDLYTYPAPGSLMVHKYLCPAGTTPTREANAPNGSGATTVPAGCVPQSGVNFGYIHQADETDYSPPYPGLEDSTPFTPMGATSATGVVVKSNLDPTGRYDVAELTSTGSWTANPPGLLAFYCAGTDTGAGTNNYEIAFVPEGGTTHCVAYNQAPPVCGNAIIESGETCDDGNLNNGDACSNSCQTQAPQACTAVNNGNLVGHWKLDEGTGSLIAIDSAGANNNGTLENGPTYTSGTPAITPNPSALNFDGSNDDVRVANSADFRFGTGSFTVSSFIKTNDGERGVVGNFNGTNRGWGSFIYDNSNLNFFAYGDGGSNDVAFPAPGILNNQWHHIAGVYTRAGANVTISVYYDGALIGSTTLPVGDITSASDLLLGDYLGQPNYQGRLDDVRVYGRALSAAEIANLANGCTAPAASSSSSSISSSSSSASSTGSSVPSSSSSSSSSVASVPPGPMCNGMPSTVYVQGGIIRGGPDNGMAYNGTLRGTSGNDVMSGTNGNDRIRGDNGDDVICGLNGNDRITGDNGNDTLFGQAGADDLDGGNGDDTLDGGAGGDELDGGNGNDTLKGGAAADELDAGTGNDILCGNAAGDRLDAGSGNDKLDGGAGSDNLRGGSGTDACASGESRNSCESTPASIPECAESL